VPDALEVVHEASRWFNTATQWDQVDAMADEVAVLEQRLAGHGHTDDEILLAAEPGEQSFKAC
jgi:hypothetical protein